MISHPVRAYVLSWTYWIGNHLPSFSRLSPQSKLLPQVHSMVNVWGVHPVQDGFHHYGQWRARPQSRWLQQIIIIIMYIYHVFINTLSTRIIHINLNTIFYTHVEDSPTKTIYIRNHTHTHTHTQTHTHNRSRNLVLILVGATTFCRHTEQG